jgi:hypothetical protein
MGGASGMDRLLNNRRNFPSSVCEFVVISARASTEQASAKIHCCGLCWKDIARVTYRVAISQASPI